MNPEKPQKVKYFMGVLFSNGELLEEAEALCVRRIGEIDLRSEVFPFEATNYYNIEMGTPLFRLFFSFKDLMSPGKLAKLKILGNLIEDQLGISGNRKVNLDIGYLDFHKMILASAKYNGQKIYLNRGIYADLTLRFENGGFHPAENTFPDFRSGVYNEIFQMFRNTYKAQMNRLNSPLSG